MKSTLTLFAALAACALPWSPMMQTQTETKSESKDLCVQSARGPIGTSASTNSSLAAAEVIASVAPTAHVGQPAPDFEANAFVDGGFKPVRLSDYQGKWVVLCFYPGDFTFV